MAKDIGIQVKWHSYTAHADPRKNVYCWRVLVRIPGQPVEFGLSVLPRAVDHLRTSEEKEMSAALYACEAYGLDRPWHDFSNGAITVYATEFKETTDVSTVTGE